MRAELRRRHARRGRGVPLPERDVGGASAIPRRAEALAHPGQEHWHHPHVRLAARE